MKKKILIIDDDQDILEPLSLLLEDDGYKIMTTPKGDMAYTKVIEFKPDLILLDLLLSGSDGRKICKKLKADKVTKNIPIIMMSAHPGAKVDAKASGADAFIAKPFESGLLAKLIEETLN